MRKITLNLLALLCAVFAFQSVSAAASGEKKEIYSQTFQDGLNGFNEEVAMGGNYIWQWFSVFKMAYADGGGLESDSRLVSPEIELLSENVVSFDYTAMEFGDLANEFCLSVRAGYGEWTDIALPVVDGSGDLVHVEFNIPASFDYTKVQFGLRYHAASGSLLVSNFLVEGVEGEGKPVQKVDPELSFNAAEAEAFMGDTEVITPTLNNPYNVAVTYSSSDTQVADVDAATGVVTLVGEGVATIKAVSAENDAYLAGEAAYTLTVKPESSKYEPQELFKETFESGLGEFNEEIIKGANNVWQWFFAYSMAYGDAGGVSSDCRLISPEINLLSKNVIKFDYIAMEFDDLVNNFTISIRKLGGEWTELSLNNPDNSGNLSAAEINIPEEFDNCAVEMALRYYAAKGSILVSNFVVTGVKGGVVPDQKADPEIGFAVKEMRYNISSGEPFVAPEFYNPHNLNVQFSSSDGTVAGVTDDGSFTMILGVGSAKITAVSYETEEYRYAKASYVLTVEDDPTSIEGISADKLNDGKIYDIQGRRVDRLGKGIFIINGKKVIIK